METKCDIFRRYAEWKAAGGKKNESPIADLVEEYGCNAQYPKRLYDKCLDLGSVENQWSGGRPTEFSEAFFEKHMVPLIREFRSRQKVASVRTVVATIKKKRRGAKAPGLASVHKAKKVLGFNKINVKAKPKLNTDLWAQKLKMATERRGPKIKGDKDCKKQEDAYVKANARKVQGDEKWHSEEKGTQLAVEARKSSPVPNTVLFKAKDAETRTQLTKIMFLLCVTSKQPIGYYELDFNKWNKEKQQKTKAGKDAKGITAAFLKPILKVANDARKKLGPGPISFLHDKTPCYQAIIGEGDDCGFDGGIEMAAGKAPDMSFLDAGVCQVMEDAVEAEGAETADEIRATVKKARKKITPEFCERVARRVFNNMGEVIKLKGGNFYSEAK